MLKGIDISHNNGTPDFGQAKAAGVSFVYVKATEGKTYVDPLFQPNMFNAMRAGLPVGAYHFARPDHGNKPEDEAQHFLDTISTFNYNLLPVLDLEVSVPNMSGHALYNWAKTFVDTVKAKTGHDVLFYTYLSYLIDEYPELIKLASECPLWIAEYNNAVPSIPGWDWVMWQYTETGNVPGVGTCDCDYIQDLNAITIKSKTAPMYRVTVDGNVVVDTAYPDKIANAVKDAVKSGAKKITVKPR